VNDDNGNGGTGGKVTGNGGNVIDGGRNGGNMSPGGLGIVIGGGRNGGNVSLGGLRKMVNGNGGMVSGGDGGSCFNARRLQTTGITPSDRVLSIFHCGLADLRCWGTVQKKKSSMGCDLNMYPTRSH
jgi:hypothetical protein